ncbi:hypothetical protein EHI48_08365 [Rhizobium sp. WSM1325]|nr:hypothetical protein EHI43_21835 [Rhizobium leguminosarum]RWY80441.1 hypothetical protein EHI48_08365 [Rhizobium leguminosarum]
MKREPGDESPRPDYEHRASRLGTKFKLVKIVILYLTNVQNIHVTLVRARPQLARDQDPKCAPSDGECE